MRDAMDVDVVAKQELQTAEWIKYENERVRRQPRERAMIIIAVDDDWKGRDRCVKEWEGTPLFVDGEHNSGK